MACMPSNDLKHKPAWLHFDSASRHERGRGYAAEMFRLQGAQKN
jgi:hypothetical protein